jgi:hypothetical protein
MCAYTLNRLNVHDHTLQPHVHACMCISMLLNILQTMVTTNLQHAYINDIFYFIVKLSKYPRHIIIQLK